MTKDSIKTTDGPTFHSTGDYDNNQRLFSVNPNIPILDALQSVSCLMSTVDDSIMNAAMGEPLQDNAAWLIRHTLESAKAVVDSLIYQIEQQQSVEKSSTPVWERKGGYVHFYMLDEVHIQRGPFGKYGPFPTANSMRQALDRLEARFPDLIMISRRGGLCSDMTSNRELTEEYEKTLEKLAALGV